MNLKRWRYSTDWNSGTYQSAYLDSAVLVSPYSHPSVVGSAPAAAPTVLSGATLLSGTLPADILSRTLAPGGNLWATIDEFGLTPQAGDTLSFSTTATQVTLTLAGILVSGQGTQSGSPNLAARAIHNGGIVTISVDGTVRATIDTSNGLPASTLFLDGSRHTILITHTGGYNSAAVHPIGPGAAVVGSGATVAHNLTTAPILHAAFVAATWNLVATSTTQYALYQTLPGGSPTLIASGLTTGTTYADSAHVPGVSVTVAAPAFGLVVGDAATFTTDTVVCAIQSASFGYTGVSSNTATYQSAVIDSGDAQTQWFLAEWIQNQWPAGATLVFAVGDTPTPDDTWTSVQVAPGQAQLSDGTYLGTAGLLPAAPTPL